MNVSRTQVTYNSAIEALYTAGENVRAELVYQSALRLGIYSHWETGKEGKLMDLHNFPLAVGKTAIMHVLGDFAAFRLPVHDLVIVTGRGKHAKPDGTRGTLRTQLDHFLRELGVELTPDSNPGRIAVSAKAIHRWLDAQRSEIQTGSVHKNLFLQVCELSSYFCPHHFI